MRTHEYQYVISTDNLWEAIAQAEDSLSDLLDQVLRTSERESELQSVVELRGAIARHQEQLTQDSEAASSESEDDDVGEFVE